MPFLKNEPKTTGTEIHKALTAALEAMGFAVEEEREFSPYSVDCYIEQLHCAFEADGPQHSETRDKKRDMYLLGVYGLPVVRVKGDILRKSPEYIMKRLARTVMLAALGTTAEVRRARGGV